MREIKCNTITLSGEEFPLYCDLYVLSKIQERMSVNQFERDILGAAIVKDEEGKPIYDENKRIKLVFDKYNIDTLIFGLTLMINEGLLIRSEQTGEDYEEISEKYIARISDKRLEDLSTILHDEFNRCFNVKKNMTPTQKKNRKTKTSK